MTLSHETTQMTMIGSGGVTAGSGGLTLIQGHYSLITLAFVGTATFVTALSFVLNYRLNLREDTRKEELHRKSMAEMPDKIEGTDNDEQTKEPLEE